MNRSAVFLMVWLLTSSAPQTVLAQVHVVPLDEGTKEASADELKNEPHYELHGVPGAPAPKTDARPSSREAGRLPEPEERDRVFRQAGLLGALTHWDALERDLLWIRSQALDASALVKKYRGKLPEKALKKLSSLQKARPPS